MTRVNLIFYHLKRAVRHSSLRCFCSGGGNKLLTCLDEPAVRNYLTKISDEEDSTGRKNTNYLTKLFAMRKEVLSNLEALKSLKTQDKSGGDMLKLVDEEENIYKEELQNVEVELLKCLAPPPETGNEAVVEITAGIGGKEAALFSRSLFEMYCNYADFKKWNNFVDEMDVSDLGGIKHARIYVEGSDALRRLTQESGIHRVQRIPSTEKSGRIHTSTVAVAVLPQTSLVDIHVSERDLIVETMRSSGAGGQHVNKTDSAVRMTHVPSGLVVECQEDRSQIKNKQIALQKLKLRLNEKAQREQDSKLRGSRKSQVGTSARSDKVRTYNFPQDRVTDHRLSQTIHNIPGFLNGDDMLDATIDKLIVLSDVERLEQFINEIRRIKYN